MSLNLTLSSPAIVTSYPYQFPYTNPHTLIVPSSVTLPTTAGARYIDPEFGMPVMLAANPSEGTLDQMHGFVYGNVRPFNADNTLILINNAAEPHGVAFRAFNPSGPGTLGTKYSLPAVTSANSMNGPQMLWHPTNPLIAFCAAPYGIGPKVRKMDFTDPSNIVISDYADFTGVGSFTSGMYIQQMFLAADGNTISGTVQLTSDNTSPAYFVATMSPKAVLCYHNDQYQINEGIISRDGTHVYVHRLAATGAANQAFSHNVAAHSQIELGNNSGFELAHYDTFGTKGIVGWDGYFGQLKKLNMNDPTNPTVIVDYRYGLGSAFQGVGGHIELSTVHASMSTSDETKVMLEYYQTNEKTSVPMSNEITAWAMDGSQGVERYLNHRFNVASGDYSDLAYYAQPHASFSRDRRWLAFGGNLGVLGGKNLPWIAGPFF